MPRPRDVPPKLLPLFLSEPTGYDLPFVLELWNRPRTRPESVIAVAGALETIGPMLEAAKAQYPDRKLVLRRGAKVLNSIEP